MKIRELELLDFTQNVFHQKKDEFPFTQFSISLVEVNQAAIAWLY